MAGRKKSSGHDIIVVGASAGEVETLKTRVAALLAGLPAALRVVLHISPWSPSLLDGIWQLRPQWGPSGPSPPGMGFASIYVAGAERWRVP